MEKVFKTIAYIIENTNGQVVELNNGDYLYLSNEVITDIVRANKDVYDNIFNEGVKTSEPIVEATKKDAEGMSKRIKELEAQLKDYVNYINELNDTINNNEATIAQYIRDINCLNEIVEQFKVQKDSDVKIADKESKSANSVEDFDWGDFDEYDK